MNLNQELDDFDGGSNYEDDLEGGEEGMRRSGAIKKEFANISEEISAEDKGTRLQLMMLKCSLPCSWLIFVLCC